MHGIQDRAYRDCFRRYWNESEMLTAIDVDEFVFPAPLSWGKDDMLGDATRRYGALRDDAHDNETSSATVAYLNCYTFGINGFIDTPRNVIGSYLKRASYSRSEKTSSAVISLTTKTKHLCSRTDFNWKCDHQHWGKAMYFPNSQQKMVIPDVHGPVRARNNELYTKVKAMYNRTLGMNCNHIWIRSYNSLISKGVKNRNAFYVTLGNLTFDNPYFGLTSVIEDRQAEQFFNMTKAKRGRLQSPS